MDDSAPPKAKRWKKKWGLPEWLAVGVAVLMLWAIFTPANSRHLFPPTDSCQENLRHIQLALVMYADDSDGRPPTSDWSPALKPYLRGQDVLTCPLVAERHQLYGYAMNNIVATANFNTIDKPSQIVALFETDGLHPSVVANLAAMNVNRHEGASCVVYLDGHSKVIKEGASP